MTDWGWLSRELIYDHQTTIEHRFRLLPSPGWPAPYWVTDWIIRTTFQKDIQKVIKWIEFPSSPKVPKTKSKMSPNYHQNSRNLRSNVRLLICSYFTLFCRQKVSFSTTGKWTPSVQLQQQFQEWKGRKWQSWKWQHFDSNGAERFEFPDVAFVHYHLPLEFCAFFISTTTTKSWCLESTCPLEKWRRAVH